MSKHTPGPWIIKAKKTTASYDLRITKMVQEWILPRPYEFKDSEHEANTHLIAAAPDLLEALQEIVRNDPYNQSSAGIIARAAIAKATGEAA